MLSLLMGREFKLNQYAVLLEFDNKDEGEVEERIETSEKLNMDRYKAPKQFAPIGGLHHILNMDGGQAKRVGSSTCATYTGVKYAMDLKFKNGWRNCQPRKIEGHGA